MKLKNENQLTEDELEQVAGGSILSDDSRFLNVLLRGKWQQCDRYGEWRAGEHFNEIVKAWASVGVELYFAVQGKDGKYCYNINGKEVSRYDAWLHAEQVVGRHLKRADWDW